MHTHVHTYVTRERLVGRIREGATFVVVRGRTDGRMEWMGVAGEAEAEAKVVRNNLLSELEAI